MPLMVMWGLFFTAVVALLLPWAGLIVMQLRKWRIAKVFFIGMLCFFVSQLIVRMPLMSAIGATPLGAVMVGVAGVVIAALTAGLFEETGRWIAMKYLMAKERRFKDAIAFGWGHAGLEMLVIVGLAAINNLMVALAIDGGTADQVLAALPPERQQEVLAQFAAMSPFMAFAGGLERIFALCLHLAFSALVMWGLIKGREKLGWGLAVLAHFVANLGAGLGVYFGLDIIAVEAILLVCAIGALVALRFLRRQWPDWQNRSEPEDPDAWVVPAGPSLRKDAAEPSAEGPATDAGAAGTSQPAAPARPDPTPETNDPVSEPEAPRSAPSQGAPYVFDRAAMTKNRADHEAAMANPDPVDEDAPAPKPTMADGNWFDRETLLRPKPDTPRWPD